MEWVPGPEGNQMIEDDTTANPEFTPTNGDSATGSRDDATTRRPPLVGLDFLKFFGLGGIGGLLLAGYAYVDTFYGRFGLALHEIGIGYLETIEFVAFLLKDYYFVIASIVVAILSSAAVAYVRFSFGNFGFYLSVAIIFLLIAHLAVFGGSQMAHSYADDLIEGKRGRLVYCELKGDADFHEDFRNSFFRWTKDDRILKVKETETMIYLTIVAGRKPTNERDREPNHGQTLAIQKDALSICRVDSGNDKHPN